MYVQTCQEEQPDLTKMVQFKLDDQNSLVVFNGVVCKLGPAIPERQKTEPYCPVAYHKLDMKSEPGCFTLDLASQSNGWNKS